MITEAKLLSDCGTRLVMDDTKGEEYQINIQEGSHILLVMGFSANKPAAKFEHPNLIASVKRIHEFKTYLHNGGKHWYSKAGVDKYFVIPKNQIKILPVKGYSYIKAEINGVKVTFNVSGGTGNGWTDYLSNCAHISVNHKLADIKKIAEVAVRNTEFESTFEIKPLEADKEEYWQKLSDKANTTLKHKIFDMVKSGKEIMIRLRSPYRYQGDDCVKITEIDRGWDKKGAVKYLRGFYVRVKPSQVDWTKTFAINGL